MLLTGSVNTPIFLEVGPESMFSELPSELEVLCLQSCWRPRRGVDVFGEEAEERAIVGFG